MLPRIVLIAIAVVAGWGAVVFAEATVDYYRGFEITKSLRHWDETGRIESDRQLAAHIETVERLVEKHPSDPGLRFTAIKLYEWRAYLQRYSHRHQKEALEQSVRHVERAIHARPLWGRAWAAWLDLGARIDNAWRPELEYRLNTALTVGRHDLHTQQYLVPFALREWNALPAEVKPRLREFLRYVHDKGGRSKSQIDIYLRQAPDHPLAKAFETT